MRREAKRAARSVEESTPMRWAARAGFAGNGLVHLLMGVIILVVVFGGEGESDQAGAFKALAAAPFGLFALWALVIAVTALGVYYVVEGLLIRDRSTVAKWRRRAVEWGKAVIYLALGFIAGAIALGARPQGDRSLQQASTALLQMPGGPWLLGAIGLTVLGSGIAFAVMGVLTRFRPFMVIPGGVLGVAVIGLGVIGYIAKGIALGIVGVLLTMAAVTVDGSYAGGFDGAVEALMALPFGSWLGGAVGAGFLAYALFLFARTRYADI
ncbi:DUF1206 domain-containing protein [Microbacterium aurantiacum]|uniref:DUF1206 domain-containing protein n=1 Tax=Microbacterium aurantiacum TaxID=162393 RepID=UPI003F493919